MTQRALWNRWRHVFTLFVANSGAVERRLRGLDLLVVADFLALLLTDSQSRSVVVPRLTR